MTNVVNSSNQQNKRDRQNKPAKNHDDLSQLLDNFLVPSLRQSQTYKIDTPDVDIKLDQNECPWDWPQDIKQAICKKLEGMSWNRYPSAFSDQLTEQIARYVNVPPEAVLTGPGSNFLLTLLLSALTRHKVSDVVIAQPSFPLYESHCQYEGIPYKIWPLNNDLEYDTDLLPPLQDYSLVVFASPNNPVGNTFPKEKLKLLLEQHPKTIFIGDEAYFEFSNDPYTDLLEQFSNLILVRTFSKTLGAAGLRLGFVLGHPKIISELAKLRLPFLLNHFTLAAANVLFESGSAKDYVAKMVTHAVEERERVYKELTALTAGSDLSVIPSQANFLTIRLPNQERCTAFYQHLIKDRILVRNISKAPKLAGCLRVSIGNSEENDRLLTSVSQFR